ncbi:uncharacterized protein LOC134576866 [Pelobates fuscus]|uniref:uncharacterized protein LOC134576866 n=1 Tax=Pelobates fuscus TaxID=191477 RepID=UPI002FE4AD3D
MSILPVLVLTALCLFASASSDKASCTFNGKTFKDGETILDKCQICECVDGEIKDCSVNANCKAETVTQQEEHNAAINYEDDPNVIGSSNGNSSNRKKRGLPRKQEMKVNFPNVALNSIGLKGNLEIGVAKIELGGGERHGHHELSTSWEGKKTIIGGGMSGEIEGSKHSVGLKGNVEIGGAKIVLGGGEGHGHHEFSTSWEGKKTIIGGGVSGEIEGSKHSIGLNGDVELGGAKIELGGGEGNGHREFSTSWEGKKTIIGGGVSGELEGSKHSVVLNGNVEIGGAKIELGGGEGHGHHEFSTSWEGKKTIIGGGVSGEIEGSKHSIGLNGDVELGGAKIELGGEKGHGHREFSTSSKGKKTIIGGGVSGEIEGSKQSVGLNGNVEIGGAKIELGGGEGHGHHEFSTSWEGKKTIIGGGVSGEIEGSKHSIGLNGDVELGGAKIELGGGEGHGHREFSTSWEGKKTIIGGGVSGELEGSKHSVGLNGNVEIGGAKIELGGGEGNGHHEFSTSWEGKKTIIGGGVSGEIEGSKHSIGLNGDVELGGAKIELGGGKGHGHHEFSTSWEGKKTIIGGGVSGEIEGSKHSIGLNGDVELGGAKIELGGGEGHGHREFSTSWEGKKTIIGGGVSGELEGSKHSVGLNGNVEIGGAKIELGGGEGNGHHEFSTSWEGKKTIIGGGVSGEIEGSKHSIGLNGDVELGGAKIELGGGKGHGHHEFSTSWEGKKTIIGGGVSGEIEGSKHSIGLNGDVELGGAKIELGGGEGHGHREFSTSWEGKKTIIGGGVSGELEGSKHSVGLNGNVEIGGAKIELGGGEGHGHHEFSTSWEGKKTIIGGGVSREIEGSKHSIGLNGDVELGGAKIELGGGKGHGHREFSTSWEGKKTIIGGGVSGELEGSKHSVGLNGNVEIGGAKIELGGGEGHGHHEFSTSWEGKKTIIGGGVSGEIEGSKHSIGLNGDVELGGAKIELGGGKGHGHREFSTSWEEKKTIIGGGVSGELEGSKHSVGLNGNVEIGGAKIELGGGEGHGHHEFSTSWEGKKTIIGGGVSREIEGSKHSIGLNGDVELGGAKIELGGGKGHGHREFSTSWEGKKTIIGGGVSGELEGSKHSVGLNGNVEIGGAKIELGGGEGHGHHEFSTSWEGKKTIIGGGVSGEIEGSKHSIGLNGDVELGGAKIELGGGKGHGHREFSTSWEGKKTIIGGGVSGELEGSKQSVGLNGNVEIGGAKIELGGGEGHGHHEFSTSWEGKKTIIGGGVSGEIEGSKHSIGLNGDVELGGAKIELGGGEGHGHREFSTSWEGKKTIIGGGVSGELEGSKHSVGLNGNVEIGGAKIELGGGEGHGHHEFSTSWEGKKTIIGGGVSREIEGSKHSIGLNGDVELGGAKIELGGGKGHGHREFSTSWEGKKTIIGGGVSGELEGSKHSVGLNGNVEIGGAKIELGGGEGHGHHEFSTSWEGKKTIIGGGVSGEIEGSKHSIGLNGDVELGGAKIELGGGKGHGHREFSTSWEEKKTIIGGGVSGELEGSKHSVGLNGNVEIGGAKIELGGGEGHGHHEFSTSWEGKKTIIGGGVSREIEGSKHSIGLNGDVELGGAKIELGGGKGHGHREFSTSWEGKKTIIGGGVSGELEGSKHSVGLNGNVEIGGAKIELGGGEGHGHHEFSTSWEGKKTIIGGGVSGEIEGSKHSIGLNGDVELGGAKIELGGGKGHGHREFSTSWEGKKTIIGGGVSGELEGSKQSVGLNGNVEIGGAKIELGGGEGHGHHEFSTSWEGKKTIIGGGVSGEIEGSKHSIGLNGDVELGGAKIELGGGEGHGHREFSTSWEGKKTIIGGGVSGELEGSKHSVGLNGNVEIGGAKIELGGGEGHGHHEFSTSWEGKKTIIGGGVSREIEGSKHSIGLNGDVELGGAKIELGGGKGHGHREFSTSWEGKKTIIGGGVSGELEGSKHSVGLNGNVEIGGAKIELGGGEGHGHHEFSTSWEGKKTIIGGGVSGEIEGSKHSIGLNGDVELGGAKIELGGGKGHGHHEFSTSWEGKKTIIGGGVSGEIEGSKHSLGLNGDVKIGGAKIELGGGAGHRHHEFNTTWEVKKTISGGGESGELEGIKHGENVQVGGEAGNLKVKDEDSDQNEKHDFNSEEVTATFHGKVEGGWKKNWKEESSEERKDSFKSRKNFHGVTVQLGGEAASVELNGKFGHKNKKHEEGGSNSEEETDKSSRKKGWKKTSESEEIHSSENTEDSFNKEKRRGGGKQKFASSSEQSTITIKGKGKGGWKKFSESESSIEEEKSSFKKHKGTHVKGTFEEKTQHGHAYGHNNKGKTTKWGFKDGENESHDESSEEKFKKTIEDIDLEIEETGTVATPTEIPVTVYEPPVITERVPLLYTENEVKSIVTEPETLPITRGPPIDCIFNKNSVADGDSLVLNCVTCTCISGSLTCVKNLDCPGICSITGYQMVRTFDGTLYENPGTCSYVLVKTPSYSITLNNKPCVELRNGIQDPKAVCIESVDIYIPLIASLSLSYDGTITSAGKQSAIPYFIHDTITILRSSSVFLDVASDFFNLQYDFKGNRLYVILQNSYKDQTSGLCGTYNDNRNDDYRSSLDITETVSGLFAVSWKTPGQCADKPKEAENEDKRVTAELTCTSTFQDSIFEDCRLLIDTHGYQASCANSIYYGNSEGFCSAIADYAYRCARAGIFIPVSSTFTFCTPTCQEDMLLSSDNLFTQQDCAEYSATLLKISSSIPLNEACICPRDLYYDATLDRCVSGEQCPCYVNNDVYKLGQNITFPNGESCPCERILQCSGTDKPDNGGVIKECPENEIFSDCSLGYGKSCEPSCEFLAVLDQGCGAECATGCICKHGLLRGSDGNCIPLNECPCIHGDDVYNPGETLASDCNTCTCENGKFSCTTNPCNKVCNAYAGSQFFLFDNIWKTYTTRDCPVVLVQSREDAVPNFRVIMQNVRSESVGGALARKYITIAFEGISVALTEGEPSVVYDPNSKAQVKIYRSGFYVVAHFTEGLTVYYDQHLDVIVQLEPSLQGKVLGMCGDADGSTTTELAISNMEQYASQYLLGECAEPEVPPFVPSDNHRSYVEKRCSVLKSSEFALCHTEVNVQPYYAACVEETESCREGESCLCFCTSLAAYARACCRKGITIDWRNPDTCPSPCEYYNRASGEGPYRLIMLNGNTLVTDFVTKKVYVIQDDLPNNLAATFMVTPSLYIDSLNGRKLVSLESAEHPNFFIVQNSDGSLSLQKWQPSVSFRSQATFIMRAGRWVRGYNALESFTSRGQYLSIKNDNSLIMSKVKSGNMLVMNFKLREESFGLPSFSICTWKYRACSNPCIPTCSDPLGTKCTLTLKVEGCYPICAPGMVFDEITHRCVRFEDCISFGVPTTPPPEQCKDVQCKVETCEQGKTQVRVDSPDPCCPKYICVPEQTTTPSTSTLEPCKDVQCIVEKCEQWETQVRVDSPDPCCPKYICVPEQTTTPSTSTLEPCKDVKCIVEKCEQGETQVRVDSTDPCCPKYICVPEQTTTPSTSTLEPCKDVQCIVEKCEQGETQVRVDSTDPCCPKYICVPEQTTTPSTSTLEPCKDVKCIVEKCEQGETQVRVDSTDPCCPKYICVSVQTTTPSTSTVEPCKNVQCIVETCEQGENKVRVDSTDPCCPTYICVPVLTTTPSTTTLDACWNVHCPVVTCNEGENLVRLDSADPCCAREVCVGTTTTTVPTTTEDKCKHVVCDVTICDKSGSYVKELPWSDPCCPRYECACKMCENPPICENGEPPIAQFDENTQCCPVYICGQTKTTTTVSSNTPNPCRYVECPTKTCNYGEYLVAINGTDPCCLDKICIPEVTTPEPPISTITTPSPCENVQCPTSKCDFGDTVLVKVDSENPCCALYECVPPTTTPTTVTTTKEKCWDIVCPVHDCYKEGTSKVEIKSDDPCCKAYDCECQPCSPAPFCNGNKPIMSIDPETQCCPTYRCPPENPPTPFIPTTTENPCNGIVCESVTCSKKGEVLVDLHVTGSCCPHVVCECSNACPNPPVCEYGNTPIKSFNPEIECCPEYICNPIEPTTPTVECKDVVCPTKTCDEEHTLVAVLGNDPCCFDYTCVPHITTTTPQIVITTPTPEPCRDVVCPPPTTCNLGDTTLVKIDPANPCCNINECIVVPGTTTPHSTTTLDQCRDVTCTLPECSRDNSYPLSLGHIEPCCESYTCVCKPCGPPPSCDGYETIFNSETQCCPTYICPIIPTTTPIPPTTTENPCLNIVCEPPAQCSKKGETLVDVSWGNTCCRNIVCQCPTVCPDAPVCENDKPAIKYFNPEIQCCPEYECQIEVTTPTPLLPCRDVVCPTKTCDENHILVAVKGDDLCCFDYICEPIIHSTISLCVHLKFYFVDYMNSTISVVCLFILQPPPESTTPFIEPCHDVVCNTKHNCNPEDAILIRSDPENPCCSIYECIPPTTTTVPPTTTEDHCRDVTCSVPTCSRDGSYAQPTGGFYACCPEYTCVCRPCASIPFCNGDKAIMSFDPFNECCPTYECPPPPPPPPTTPGLCSGVTCIKDVTCKFNEIEIHDVNPSDPCCPLYRCGKQRKPQTTTLHLFSQPSVPTTTIVTSSICSNVKCYKDVQCRPDEPVIELPNPFDPCCPRYECGTVTPTPTVIITTSQVDCSARVCERKVCGDSQKLVERVNPLDPCCPLYTCECECKTVPSCSSDERLVAVHQYNQCCPKLKCERKRDECHPVPTEVTLTSGQCSATVVLSSCSGYCYSKSDFDSLWNPISKCRCCSATSTHAKNFELPCPNGSRARLTVLEAKECGCNKCSDNDEHHSGSGSGSGSGEEGSGFLLWSNLEGRN